MAGTYNSSTLSALFNHLVIEKIMDFLEIPELKNSRLVCKLWNGLGTPFLSRKVNIALEGIKLEEFLETIASSRSSSAHMFTNFTVKLNSFQSTNTAIISMWSTIHFNIKHLTLHVTTLYAKNELRRLLLMYFPCLKSLKLVVMKYWGILDKTEAEENEGNEDDNIIHPNANLKTFQLSYLGSSGLYGFADSDDDEFHFPINWKSFFERFPDLRHIGITGLSSIDVWELLEALVSLQRDMLHNYRTITSLEILDENVFPQTPNDEHLLQISNLQNDFESIHLEIGPHATISLLNDLLKKHVNSLKSLRLRRYPHQFVSLPITLTENNLWNVKFLEVSEDLLNSLSFLPYFPSLEKLHVIIRDYRQLNCCSIVCNTTSPLQITHSRVKCLYIEPPLISKECITKLSICLPGLENLKIRVNNEMLREICSVAGLKDSSCWKSLQNLHITSWDGLTDEGITGINEQVLKFWGGFSSNVDIKNYRSNPFIGDIPDLKSLTIEMWSDYDNHISDWSVLFGVMEVESLQEVIFVRCGITSSAFSSIPILKKFIIH